MQLLHELAKMYATFDGPHLVSQGGLIPVMALAQRAGLGELAAEHVRVGRPCGVNGPVKIACLAADSAARRGQAPDQRAALRPALALGGHHRGETVPRAISAPTRGTQR